LNLFQDFEAGESGHVQVQQQDVIVMVSQLGQDTGRVADSGGGVLMGGEQIADTGGVSRIVVDNENSWVGDIRLA
jgi:hypothetical protein